MKNILFTLALLISFVSFGQDYKGIQMCLALQSNGYSSNTQAEEALGLIMNVSGLNKNFILAPCDNIENAYAIRYNNERYIIYDKGFMSAIDGEKKWRNLTILAHEVAHHLNNHPLEIKLINSSSNKTFSKRREQELEADEFAGFTMARLGAPINEVLAAISSISNDKDDTYSSHPSRNKRINAINQGYERAGINENSSWFDWNASGFFKKIENLFFGDDKGNLKEEIADNKKEDALILEKEIEQTNNKYYPLNTSKQNSIQYQKYWKQAVSEQNLFNYDEALIKWNMALAVEVDKEDASYILERLASLKMIMKNYSEAMVDYSKAIELNPNYTMAYVTRAELKYFLNNLSGACEDWRKASSLDPSDYGSGKIARKEIKKHCN